MLRSAYALSAIEDGERKSAVLDTLADALDGLQGAPEDRVVGDVRARLAGRERRTG